MTESASEHSSGASVEGFIVHPVALRGRDEPTIGLVGRLENGETFAVVDRRERPRLYLRAGDADAAAQSPARHGGEADEAGRTTMDGEACVAVRFPSVPSLERANRELLSGGIRTYEGDLRFYDQYLMERRIHGPVRIAGTFSKGRHVDRVYVDPDIRPGDWFPSLSCVSLDIETNAGGTEVYAVGLATDDPWRGDRRRELHMHGASVSSEGVTTHADESRMLQAVARRLRELDPDIITGWNVIEFDLRILFERFHHHRLPTAFGRSDDAASYLPGNNGRSDAAVVPGRQVLDGLRIARAGPQRFPDNSLDTVAQIVLGVGKLDVQEQGEKKTDAIERQYREDPATLAEYCMRDAELVLDILARTGLWELTLRRSVLIGIGLSRAWTSIAGFEHLYIEAMHERGLVAPTRGVDALPMGTAPGGAIIKPRTGLSVNVLVFDFKSLYPSIIRTFNIDPCSHVPRYRADGVSDLLEAPNGALFRREPGILPQILEEFFESREQAKRRNDPVASYVYKIIMNSFYGVLGATGCRFAGSDLAGAITSFGHRLLHWGERYLTRTGYEVLYGDTDSLFVRSDLPDGTSYDEVFALGTRLADELNHRLESFVREEYDVAARLELEFETIYSKFFIPPMRGFHQEGAVQAGGRAKGYAGMVMTPPGDATGESPPEAPIEVKGMEAVRRDWTDLAHEFQLSLLRLLFESAEPRVITEYCRKVVEDLYAGALDARCVYTKALRRAVDEYSGSKPAHVKAAMQLDPDHRQGLVRYVQTKNGPEPVDRRSSDIDYDHYVQKQLRPIAGAFSDVLPIDLDALFGENQQLWLFG